MNVVRVNTLEKGLPCIIADVHVGDAICFIEGSIVGFKSRPTKEQIAQAPSLPALCKRFKIDLKDNQLSLGIVQRVETTLGSEEREYFIYLGTDYPAQSDERNSGKKINCYEASPHSIALYQILNR